MKRSVTGCRCAAKVDELLARGSFDAVADLAEAYPRRFSRCRRLKREGREHLLPMRRGLMRSGHRRPIAPDRDERSQPHQDYVQSNANGIISHPEGSGLHPCRVDAGDITAAEAPMLVARCSRGIDTTSRDGAAIYCLARFPEEFARLRSDPSLARNAFEEADPLRSPVADVLRTTTKMSRSAAARSTRAKKS